jgi:hypothetical protein
MVENSTLSSAPAAASLTPAAESASSPVSTTATTTTTTTVLDADGTIPECSEARGSPLVTKKDIETATDATADSVGDEKAESCLEQPTTPIVSVSKKSRPPYKFDPNKITLRFLFANRDGLTVTIECEPTDTVGEVKGALMSVWPDGE